MVAQLLCRRLDSDIESPSRVSPRVLFYSVRCKERVRAEVQGGNARWGKGAVLCRHCVQDIIIGKRKPRVGRGGVSMTGGVDEHGGVVCISAF